MSFRFNPSREADPAEKRSSKGRPLKGPAPRLEPLNKGGRRSSGGGSWEATGEEAKEERREEKARLKGRRRRGNAARLDFLLEGRRLLATITIGGMDDDERRAVAMAVLWRPEGREIFDICFCLGIGIQFSSGAHNTSINVWCSA